MRNPDDRYQEMACLKDDIEALRLSMQAVDGGSGGDPPSLVMIVIGVLVFLFSPLIFLPAMAVKVTAVIAIGAILSVVLSGLLSKRAIAH
ncbi:MAG: hypothetical protein RDV48_06845 [Candidatus Eremiobacteraeota bacterium]|nr:hypothetical protein [Candidatus Eremiobacteraeota bacterium]